MTDWTAESEAAFDAYVEALVGVIGHADRAEPLKDYCLGLLLPVERKSVEPLAAVTAPSRVAAKHQSLLHFVGQAPWSDEALMGRVRDWVLPQIERHGAIRAWIAGLRPKALLAVKREALSGRAIRNPLPPCGGRPAEPRAVAAADPGAGEQGRSRRRWRRTCTQSPGCGGRW